MVTDNNKDLEAYALLIAAPDFVPTSENLNEAIGHLPPREANAVIERAAAICRTAAANHFTEADTLENLLRLAHASGMPEGEKVVPWLEARSLIQKVENGWAIVKAGPYDGSPISHHM